MNEIVPIIHPAVLRYSKGEVTASEAAELMGGDNTVHDVIDQLRQAGLPLPRVGVDREAVDRALRIVRAAR